MDSVFTRIGKSLGCVERSPPTDRTVYVDNRPPDGQPLIITPEQKFPNNKVISSKYTVFSFVPKNLFEQFRRIANFYFLTVGIIQFIIDSPVSPITSVLPLVFVVAVTGIKQGYEDWLRHKADNEVNSRKAFVVRDGKITQVKSMNIKVGDIVRVNVNHSFPCDLVMLSSHDPEGMCYVTTANLDGETNLKVKSRRHCLLDEDFLNLSAFIECQQPIPDLYKFVGRITVVKNNGEHVVKPLGPENILLRGARLKNTPYIYGCAVYTGPETKMALNSQAKSTKFSRIEKGTNKFLIIFLILLLIESLFSTILKYWYVNRPKVGQPWYVPEIHLDLDRSARKLVENFLSFMVLYNYVIPISLYVTIEVQKFVGSLYFCWDLEMYDEGIDQPAKANTSDLNEELGQVEYLFTDKTGTLTENDMQFRQCSIHGIKYIEMGGHLCEMTSTDEPGNPVTVLNENIENFLTLLALCHTVRVEHSNSSTTAMYSHTGMDYEYTASSPDEKAFVEACRRYGLVFHGVHDDRLEVTLKGEMRRYRMLHVLDFDPTRKRMSVIVQNEKDEIFLLCKGAESSILDRVKPEGKQVTLHHVNSYAMLGLRTLVLARKKFSTEEYSEVDSRLSDAKRSMQNREEKLAEVYDFVERDMELLGATAVEDRLQEDVPKTITSLRLAGIKVWVLTGDKEETAVNISYSAGHFKQGMAELRLTKLTNSVQCAEHISRLMSIVERPNASVQQFVLIVDGASLAYALKEHSNLFRQLCTKCVAVLCCRMSPLQKAEIVKLMKNSEDSPVTAAIGDGANDVSMIQEAHVGLGLMGKEGRQAMRNSDYAFAKFKFLQRVFLVHGHYYYIRLSTLVQYFFYKNVAFITGQLLYTFFSAHSQQTLFDSFDLMFYNITFTSLPVLIYGLAEQHLPQSLLIEKPHLYKKITRNNSLSFKYFILWNALGLWHTLVFFFGVYFMFGKDVHLFRDGKMMGNWSFGSIIYTVCVVTVNLKLVLSTYNWNLPVFLSYVITGVGCLGMHLVYTLIRWPSLITSSQDFYYIFIKSLSSGTVWIGMILIVVIAILPDVIVRTVHDIRTSQHYFQARDKEDKVSISLTKRSGKLTLSQLHILDNEEDYL